MVHPEVAAIERSRSATSFDLVAMGIEKLDEMVEDDFWDGFIVGAIPRLDRCRGTIVS